MRIFVNRFPFLFKYYPSIDKNIFICYNYKVKIKMGSMRFFTAKGRKWLILHLKLKDDAPLR